MIIFLVKKCQILGSYIFGWLYFLLVIFWWLYFWSKHGYISGLYIFSGYISPPIFFPIIIPK